MAISLVSALAGVSAALCSVAPVLIIDRSGQESFSVLLLNEERVVGRETLEAGEWLWTAVPVPREGSLTLSVLSGDGLPGSRSASEYVTSGMPMTHVFEIGERRVTHDRLSAWLFPRAARSGWAAVPSLIVESVPEALACPFVDKNHRQL